MLFHNVDVVIGIPGFATVDGLWPYTLRSIQNWT